MDRPHFLDFLPYRASFYDKNLKLIYSNHQPDGSFFPEDDPDALPDWIWQSLQQANTKTLHFQLPSDAFDRILMQTYQVLYDREGAFYGVLMTIQDLKPMLATYLQDSGQAIVGWSDVTSGPSISDDF